MTTTPEECPRFRLLTVGRPGTGKVSLINAIFGASFSDVIRGQLGTDDINQEITSYHNERLVIHYYQDHEPGSVEKFGILQKFITQRNQKPAPERLNAIWLCITVPSSRGRLFEESDEKIISWSQNKVPIIVVFTKFDQFVMGLDEESTRKEKASQELAEREFKERYGQILEKLTRDISGKLPYALVATSLPATLHRLVNITMQCIQAENLGPLTKFARFKGHFVHLLGKNDQSNEKDENPLNSAQVALAAAQRIDMAHKITTSIKVGEKKYPRAPTSVMHFSNVTLENVLYAIHKDIVTIWNIWDLNELHSDTFRRRIMLMVDDLCHLKRKKVSAMQHDFRAAVAMTDQTSKANSASQELFKYMCCLMGYVVDLTLILQAVFRVSVEDQFEGKITTDRVNDIIYEFVCSGKKDSIHNAIAAFVGDQHLPPKGEMANKIRSLIEENEMRGKDTQFDQTRPPLSLLLAILRIELPTRRINQITLNLMCKLLELPDYQTITSELKTTLKVELFLDFILCLLCDASLADCGVEDANKKVRMLMSKLCKKGVLPKSLFLSKVELSRDAAVGTGGHGSVFKGQYEGKLVALKVLYGVRHKEDPLRKDFCREALVWRSLSHRFILPLLGIYENKSQLYLVSPFMKNGTLIQWRKSQRPDTLEIYRVMLEVAEGIQYIHSEGIVHGDLSGGNVLLDSELHCRIADFGLTQYVEATVSRTSGAISVNYAAPELLGICNKCWQYECPGCGEQRRGKTKEADVYAFGCLYYAAFFGILPFQDRSAVQITWLVSKGEHPSRLNHPRMDDGVWNLIERCWLRNSSERPTIEHSIATHSTFAVSVFTTLITKLMALGLPVVNDDTLHLICNLLDCTDYLPVVSELTTPRNVELLLDFVILLLRERSLVNCGVQDANRKARRLMFKLLPKIDVIPKSLSITDIKLSGIIDVRDFRTFSIKGKRDGRLVALRSWYETGEDRKDSLRKAVVWRSLSHRFILPLLGIHDTISVPFPLLVSPFMVNGTLLEWRRNRRPTVAEINRVMLEVAQGIQYIHSEGMVYGSLSGKNILLDSEFHCQITGLSLTQHAEATVPQALGVPVNYAAPELLEICNICWQIQCGLKCSGAQPMKQRKKTTETDVYAFGCLYYDTFFAIMPFEGRSTVQIHLLIAAGQYPSRLGSPKMDDVIWNLIERCWLRYPAERPTMDQIVEMLIPSD